MRNILVITLLLLFTQIAFSQTADQYYNKAIDKEEQKDFLYASVLIDKAIQLNDTNIWYWLKKAEIKMNMSESELAINYIKTAISIDPANAEPYNRAGAFYDSRGYNDSAVYMYNMAMNKAQSDAQKFSYLMNLGAAKISVMDYEGALNDFREF